MPSYVSVRSPPVHCPHVVPSGVSVRSPAVLCPHFCAFSRVCPFTCCTLSTCCAFRCFCPYTFCTLCTCCVFRCLCPYTAVQCTRCVFRCFCLCTCCILHCPHAVFSGVSVRSPGGPAERRAAGERCVRCAHGAVGEERAVCRRPYAALVLPHHDRRLARRQSPRQLQGKAEFRAVGKRPIDHVVGFSPPTPPSTPSPSVV